MNQRQLTFCAEYLVDLNATQAAIRAGYSRASARSIGQENLTKPDIRQRISELFAARAERTQVNAEMVIQELAAVAFSNLGQLVDFQSGKMQIRANSIGAMSAIKDFSLVRSGAGQSLRIKLHDKVRALELLGRHLGLFDCNSIAISQGEERQQSKEATIQRLKEYLLRRKAKSRLKIPNR